MSKKYMRIYCNGVKIRSTGSSMKDIRSELVRFGCYDNREIVSAYNTTTDFRIVSLDNITERDVCVLMPNDLILNHILKVKTICIIKYLIKQSLWLPGVIGKSLHYSFSMEIIKACKNGKKVIDKFTLPFGVEIIEDNLTVYCKLILNMTLTHPYLHPWLKYTDDTMKKQLLNKRFGVESVNAMIDTIKKKKGPLMLKSINPFVITKEVLDSSYIIGRFIYEQEPCQMTIDYVVDEHISLEELSKLMNDTLVDVDIDDEILLKELLYIPYSVFEHYMDGRIDDYVHDGVYRKFNDTLDHESIYHYRYIVIDLTK